MRPDHIRSVDDETKRALSSKTRPNIGQRQLPLSFSYEPILTEISREDGTAKVGRKTWRPANPRIMRRRFLPHPRKSQFHVPPKHRRTLTESPKIGTPTASVSQEVADVQRLMQKCGLTYSMHSAGTTVGEWSICTSYIWSWAWRADCIILQRARGTM